MKIKFCGVCRPGDALHAARLGIDYIGVILSAGFPRSQSMASAQQIYAAANGVKRVGVFVDATLDEIAEAVTKLQLDVVQLHGHESPAFIADVRRRCPVEVWKAVRTDSAALYSNEVDALLLDGVTGLADVMQVTSGRLIIAGGLNAENVAGEIVMATGNRGCELGH